MRYRLIEYDCQLNSMFKAIKQTLSYPSISKRGLRSAVSEALRYFASVRATRTFQLFWGRLSQTFTGIPLTATPTTPPTSSTYKKCLQTPSLITYIRLMRTPTPPRPPLIRHVDGDGEDRYAQNNGTRTMTIVQAPARRWTERQ